MTAVALCGCVLVALLLRIHVASAGGLWRDETRLLLVAGLPSWSELVAYLGAHDSHPPLFYAMMRLWLATFGETETVAIALPLLTGVATIPAMFCVGRALFCRRTGLIAAVLATLSPPLVFHSALVRPYSLLSLLCLLSVFCLWQGLTRGGWLRWTAYVLTTLALLFAHNWGWMVLAGEWLACAAALTARLMRPTRRVVDGWLLAQLAILAGFSPWAPALVHQSVHVGHMAGTIPPLWSCVEQLAGATVALPPLALAAGAVLAGMGLAWRRKARAPTATRDPREGLALMLVLAVPVFAFVVAAAATPWSYLLPERCIQIGAPCVLLALARGIAVAGPAGRPWRAAALTAAISGVYLSTIGRSELRRSNAREVAQSLARSGAPGDVVLLTPAWLSSFDYYYPSGARIAFPPGSATPPTADDDIASRLADPLAFAQVRQALVAARHAGRRVWLVTHSRYLEEGGVSSEAPVRADDSRYVIASARSRQLLKCLLDLYGPPDTAAVSAGPPARFETLSALLFDPGRQVVRAAP